jgi:putative photosynthetic complex assembly protein
MSAAATQPSPRWARWTPSPVLAAGLLVLATLAAVAALRLSGTPPVAEAPSAVLVMRELRFVDRADGAVEVIDVQHPERSQLLAAGAGNDGFLRATLRTLARERKREGFDATPPFHLSKLADGRLLLEDPSTGRRVDLEAFGSTNAQRFARLLDPTAPRIALKP